MKNKRRVFFLKKLTDIFILTKKIHQKKITQCEGERGKLLNDLQR